MSHDPGGRSKFRLPAGVQGYADVSPCERFRYTLWRAGSSPSPQFVMFIGMNPSTALADVDDPTVRREWIMTRGLGFDRMLKMNVSPYRSTDPKDLKVFENAYEENLRLICSYAPLAEQVIVAHGVLPACLKVWGQRMAKALAELNVPLQCLGRTQGGDPRHPLYLKKGTPLEVYTP